MAVKKALILTPDGVIKTFTANNKWVNTELSLETLTDQNFIDQGFDITLLTSNITDIYVNCIDMGVLDTTGEDERHLWISEDIYKNLNIQALDFEDGDTPRIKITIPPFIPKDQLEAGCKTLVYSDDTAYVPEILTTTFSADSTHSQNINLTIEAQYLYNKNIVYRLTINSGTPSAWSTSQSILEDMVATIAPGMLQVGANNITIEVADADDTTKIATKAITNAITLSNDVPSILIINEDSNSFYVHFIINDANIEDTVQYQLTLTNSKGSNIVVPWTSMQNIPIDVTYQFDSNYVAVNELNVLTIEFKDNFGQGSSTSYNFNGEYKNILFVDENGAYYTTDKGVLLKMLNFGKIFGGRSSEIKKVGLQNNNPYNVDSIRINKISDTNIVGAFVELSKLSNPFTPLEVLEFGDLQLGYKEKIDFYVRIRTVDKAQGLEKFTIDALATKVE